MNTLINVIGVAGVFLFGFGCGGLLLVWQANRPVGYRAGNGHRYRLVRIDP